MNNFSSNNSSFIYTKFSHVEPQYVQESLMAGTDTTATTTEWAIAELLKHPQFAQKVQEELDDVVGFERVVDESDIPQLKYLQAIVKETFRLHPPTPLLLPHENIEGREVGGYYIPPKTLLYVNVWAIHRDSSIYENPFEFNPERFVGSNIDLKGKDFQLLPFGSGRRVCPGVRILCTHLSLGCALT
jgi:coumaroylquinate(coumaroylshikimate) 3'-monooxygenase